MIALVSLLVSRAGAAEPQREDLFVSSLGTELVRADAIGASDVDLLFGQRARWNLTPATRLLADVRFAYDPNAITRFEESRARELGASFETAHLTVLAGRHPVAYGGPRLLDGMQVLTHIGDPGRLAIGGWAGLVADEFTTAPQMRPGGGPILAASSWWGSASLMGEILGNSGGFERASTLFFGRAEVGPFFEVSTRLDTILATAKIDGKSRSGLADGSLAVRIHPSDIVRLDLGYDAYSTLRYQTQSALDPTVQRFATRAEQLGLTGGITQEAVDPTLQHTVSGVFGVQGSGTVAPFATIRSAARYHQDPAQRYGRVGPQVGVGGLAGGRLDLWLDGNVVALSGGTGGDAGIAAFLEPIAEGPAAIDGSVRLIVDPLAGSFIPGWYSDLFVDLLSRTGTVVSGGASWTFDRGEAGVAADVGWAGYLRLQQWIRPGRPLPPTRAAHQLRSSRDKAQGDTD